MSRNVNRALRAQRRREDARATWMAANGRDPKSYSGKTPNVIDGRAVLDGRKTKRPAWAI